MKTLKGGIQACDDAEVQMYVFNFSLQGNNAINSMKRNLKLELSERAVFFFLLDIEAVVSEGNPENRPFPYQEIVCVLSSMSPSVSQLFNSLVGGRWMRKENFSVLWEVACSGPEDNFFFLFLSFQLYMSGSNCLLLDVEISFHYQYVQITSEKDFHLNLLLNYL